MDSLPTSLKITSVVHNLHRQSFSIGDLKSVLSAATLYHPFYFIFSKYEGPLVTNISVMILKVLDLIFLMVNEAVLL